MKNGRLEYQISFSRNRLRNDIVEKLHETHRYITYVERLEIAEEVIDQMQREGNSAVYNALFQSCVKRASSQISREAQVLPREEQYI